MQKYSDVVLSAAGTPVAGAIITVTTYPDGAAATIYGADGGPSVASVTTNANGRFSFYAPNGHYSILVSGTGITPVTYNDVVLFDPKDNGAGTVNYGPRTIADKLGDSVSVKDAPFNAKGDYNPGTGLGTDDTAAIIAASNYAKANNKRLIYPSGKYLYIPTTVLETGSWAGDGAENSLLYVDCASYTGVVFRVAGSNEVAHLSIRERNGLMAKGIMLQESGPTATNALGGSLSFSAYVSLRRVWVFGGAVALDIGNMFTCHAEACMFRQAGTGVNITPADDAGDNGYANTLTFIDCEVSENNKNWSVNGAGGAIRGLSVIGGSTERAATTTSTFNNLRGASFIDHYIEQTTAISPMSFTGSTGLFLRLLPVGSNTDLTLGTNTEATIEAWDNGLGHLIGGDGTQKVTLRYCNFPATGNTVNFASVLLEHTSYNGVYYDTPYSSALVGAAGIRLDTVPQATAVSTSSATDVYRFSKFDGTIAAQSLSGTLRIIATDNSTGANSAVYEYRMESLNNGMTDALLTQVSRKVRGTDPGVSTTPFAIVSDGAGGAVKVQFTKNAAISQVNVKAVFSGLVV